MPRTVIYRGQVLGTIVEDIETLTAENLRDAILTHCDYDYRVVRKTGGGFTLADTSYDGFAVVRADHELTQSEAEQYTAERAAAAKKRKENFWRELERLRVFQKEGGAALDHLKDE
jgi:hypothetical protein